MRPHVRALAPTAAAAAACIAAAAASLGLRAGPQYDPVGWLIWGRELLHGRLDTLWYPSWKPLPVLVTLPAALAGHGALALWLVAERSAALGGVVVAARLAHRAAGATAAVLAAIAVVAIPAWVPLWLAGAIEPVVAAALVAAATAALAGRHRPALALLALAALGRVEAWPLLALAAAWAWRRSGDRATRVLGPALVALVPALWLAGDWAGAGSPMHGGVLARASGGPGADVAGAPALAVLSHVPEALPAPLLAAAAATAAWALARRRPARAELALAIAAGAWIAADAALAWRGYPANPRYLLPAAVVAAPLAAIGAGRALAALPRRAAARVPVAACLLVAIAARAPAVHQDVARAAVAVTRLDGLDAAVARAGGPPGIAACGGAATAQPYRARLAWDLRLPTAAVLRAGRRGLVFLPPGPRTAPLPLRHPGAVRVRRALRVAGWTVLRVTARAGERRPRGQAQRSVRGAGRIRSTRAGTPPTTAFSGTSPVTTA